MLPAVLASLALLPVPPVSVGTLPLHDLWDKSNLVVLAHVEKVERIRRELPEWATNGTRGPRRDDPGTSIAQLRVLQTFRGPGDVATILIPLDRSFVCDITTAVPGETAVFFLEPSRVIAAEGTSFRARLDEVFGEHDFLDIGFFGRGRMEVHGEGDSKCVESWTNVVFPDGAREGLLHDSSNCGIIRATPFDEFCRILGTYRRLENDRWLSASSGPGASGQSGWSLAVANDGSGRLVVLDSDKTVNGILRRGEEHEYVLTVDPTRIQALRESLESERPWGLPSVLGTMRPTPNQREMHFVPRRTDTGLAMDSSEAGVSLFAIDDGWMADASRRDATVRALRIWSRVRELIQDGGVADSRPDDQIWLAMAR